jgi:hypothetical protein
MSVRIDESGGDPSALGVDLAASGTDVVAEGSDLRGLTAAYVYIVDGEVALECRGADSVYEFASAEDEVMHDYEVARRGARDTSQCALGREGQWVPRGAS